MLTANFITTKLLSSNEGFASLEQQVNDYLKGLPDNHFFVDIKYGDDPRYASAMVITITPKSDKLEDAIPYR